MTMPIFEGGPTVDEVVLAEYGSFPTQGNASGWADTVREAYNKEAFMQQIGVCPPTSEQSQVKRIQTWIDMIGVNNIAPEHLMVFRTLQQEIASKEP